MINIQNLSKTYGNLQVLNEINLVFEKGKVYGIVGENGAGKTTLFKCIAGLEYYDGEVDSPFNPLKNHLGFLPTEPIVLSHITGWEYLKLLAEARQVNHISIKDQNIFDLPLDQYVHNYSTGMKKKLALLGVLIQKNDIYILDEPFNGVDIHSNMLITAIIKKLKENGKIVLIASHIFSTLRDTCDVIHLLKDGSIAKSVKPNEFDSLDLEMQDFIVGNRIDQLHF